jgi:predicted RNA binding protein YcfA (HicA-like mRNA interferase family)
MRTNPRDWRIASLEAVAAAAGANVRKSSGSHVVFEHPDIAETLSVPARRPIKPICVQRFVRCIDAVQGAHERD